MTSHARSDAPATPTHLRAFRLAVAQGWLCALCGAPILREARYGKSRGLTLEHVWPKAWGLARRRGLPRVKGYGFTLAAHGKCNSLRGHQPPTGCELIWLEAVNAKLGRDSPPIGLWRRPPITDSKDERCCMSTGVSRLPQNGSSPQIILA